MPCSQVQLARVGVCVIVLVDVVCVMIVVLITHVDVVRAVDTVFVAIFCSGRCTLYTVHVHCDDTLTQDERDKAHSSVRVVVL